MKRYVELGLVALLAVLVYEKPSFLLTATHSTLGKIILIILVGLLSKQFGLNAGLLAAIIMIVLLETNREGLESKSDLEEEEDHGSKDDTVKGKEASTVEGYDNINHPLHPKTVMSGTDQIGLDRQFKLNAEYAKNAASQQPNGCTNN